jgi:hypothetical protein
MSWINVRATTNPKVEQINQLIQQYFGGDINEVATTIQSLASTNLERINAAETLPGKAFEEIDKTVGEVARTKSGKVAAAILILKLLSDMAGSSPATIKQDPAKHLRQMTQSTQTARPRVYAKFPVGAKVSIGRAKGYEDQSGTIMKQYIERARGKYDNDKVIAVIKLESGQEISLWDLYLRKADVKR